MSEPERDSEILPGVWRFEAEHPDWTEEEGGEDGWERTVAWWAAATPSGLLLIDPLVEDWPALDRLVEAYGGAAGIVRTVHWHQRSVAEAAQRYGALVFAKPHPDPALARPLDQALGDRDRPLPGVQVFDLERAEEIAVWLEEPRALLFGDAMLRSQSGQLRVCPDSWLQPEGGPARLRELLTDLAELPVEHALVSHGPLVLGDGVNQIRTAVAR